MYILIMRKLIIVLMLVFSCQIAYAKSMRASYYSIASLKAEGTYSYSHGIMANGKQFDENAFTCAAGKQYKLGTKLLVTNSVGKSIVVTVTDRIAKRFYNTRIDLAKGAFMKLSSLDKGLISVEVDRVLR